MNVREWYCPNCRYWVRGNNCPSCRNCSGCLRCPSAVTRYVPVGSAEANRRDRLADLPNTLSRQLDSSGNNADGHTGKQGLNDRLVSIFNCATDLARRKFKIIHEDLLCRFIHVKRILPHVSSGRSQP